MKFSTNGGSAIAPYRTDKITEVPLTTKENYTFAGWYKKSDFSGNAVNFPYTVTKPVTLYAKWKALQCTVTYYANGSTGGTIPESVTVKDYGAMVTVSGGSFYFGDPNTTSERPTSAGIWLVSG
ncbi:MAG: InlB B-repeat-containing protein [Treponema sp.]|nr:InlB B-repeat-containing protein [Treponema sp.]